ncbi:myelin-associated glycoprotein isoform X2 [Salarias fasciatus]|uniref:myelin-associated glycoprotein isoform X2 n=1 Tax=Salarias fasciatus TaxID=181472 RepID=UPI00117698BA|nr:myelin-associated glycoprotein-like isoform X2 [Salarias fasciatus]
MNTLKWLWVFMCLCCKVIQSRSSWKVQMPSTVQGLLGSCVVIPCTFDYPDPGRKVTKFTGIWFDNISHVVYHPVESKVVEQYRNRTTLVGDMRQRDCSVMMDRLRPNDRGPFHFRVEIGGFNQYSFKADKVSISMISAPNPIRFSVAEEVKQGQAVNASCSVNHSCPASPPDFTWSRGGETRLQSRQLGDGQWEATSTLTFHPSRTDHRKPLQCSVRYKGGQYQQTFRTLTVEYAPVNVKVEYRPEVKEGETVHLSCSGDAHPSVSSYEWHNGTGAQIHRGRTYTLPHVSRHTGGSLYCLAINEIGRTRSSNVQLDVLYAPEIKAASSCSSEGRAVKCVCIVESSPRSTVHFVLADRVLQSTKVETHGSLTLWTLQADTGSSKFVHCLASNSQGNTNLTLSLPANSKMQTIFVATGAAVILLVILLVAVGVVKICRGTRRETPSDMSMLGAEKAVALPEYVPTKRKELYDEIQGPGIYTNDHIYGNVEVDAIYANV